MIHDLEDLIACKKRELKTEWPSGWDLMLKLQEEKGLRQGAKIFMDMLRARGFEFDERTEMKNWIDWRMK